MYYYYIFEWILINYLLKNNVTIKIKIFFFPQKCFRMDPSERLTCDQLLEHVYFDKRFTESFAADTAQAAYDLQQVYITTIS